MKKQVMINISVLCFLIASSLCGARVTRMVGEGVGISVLFILLVTNKEWRYQGRQEDGGANNVQKNQVLKVVMIDF